MKLLSIDPGNTESAWLVYDTDTGEIGPFGKTENRVAREIVLHRRNKGCHLVIEGIASYGMPVGREVFDTCIFIGRLIEAWGGQNYTLVYRKDIKLHLCGTTRAKDGNVSQALRDRIGPKGTKRQPGPTFGIAKDIWSALAIAVFWSDTYGRKAVSA